MDPNALLERLREIVVILDNEDADEQPADHDALLVELVEGFQNLDEWIRKGGFLPSSWERST
jgi:hypothetical protein